ncbi:MAG: right-handed parallel beta-helix repeat-containing protein [Sphingomonadales bacterium]
MLACAQIAAALAAAAPGSTVATGPVTCDVSLNLRGRDYRGVTLDAAGATFLEGGTFRTLQGLSIKGGTWGRADADTAAHEVIRADTVTDFSIANAVVVGNGNISGNGISVQTGSQRVTLRDNRLQGHGLAIAVGRSSNVLVARNQIFRSTSDGIDLAGNQNMIVAGNECRDFRRIVPAHPDCIQMWSIAGEPLQSDIWVINNAGTGDMQGILSSDPKDGSGKRLYFHGNYMAVTFSHTLTCTACVSSVAMDNVLASYPGSYFGVGKLKGFEDPSNQVARNVVVDGTHGLPRRIYSSVVPAIASQVGSRFDDRSYAPMRTPPAL